MIGNSSIRSMTQFGGGSILELKATDVIVSGNFGFIGENRQIRCNNIITNHIISDDIFENQVIKLSGPNIIIDGNLKFEGNNRVLTY